jgi:hypothetical protein
MSRALDIYTKIKKDGEKAINEFILTQQSEELFLDFKRSAVNGDSTFLDSKDRNNLAKAISGCGNSEGGVIVWGIECKRGADGADLPNTKFPIKKAKRFVSFLENAISGCTIPPHSRVQNHAILQKYGDGFVATLIPKSDDSPLQYVVEKRYYIRAGSSFEQIPHDLLAGMFGRRPQPKVFTIFLYSTPEIIRNTIKVSVGFNLRNGGKVLARDLFLSVWIMSGPGKNTVIGFEPSDTNFQGYWSLSRNYSVVSKPELRLPPVSQVQPVVLETTFAPPFEDELKIDISCGCEGGMLYKATLKNSPENINKVYDQIMDKNTNGTLKKEELHQSAVLLMGKNSNLKKEE